MPDADGKSGGFWSSVPGVLTGMAALVTAVGGLIVVLHKSPDPPKSPDAVVEPVGGKEQDKRPRKPKMSKLELNTNRAGSDITSFAVANIEECLRQCMDDEKCKAISFQDKSGRCWLKGEAPARAQLVGYTSAVKEVKEEKGEK
jgi:PAN domain